MLAFFNELSLPIFDSGQSAAAFFTALVELCKKTKKLGIKGIKIHSAFRTHQFAPGFFFDSWLWDKHIDSDTRTLLADMLTTMPYTDEILEQYGIAKNKLLVPKYEGTECIGLGLASDLLYDTAAVSFPRKNQWDQESYPIILQSLEEDEIAEKAGTARNISSSAHCTVHSLHFQSLLKKSAGSGRELWEMREELFPHLEFCEKVKGQLQEFDSSMPDFIQIINRLFDLESHAARWDRMPIKPSDFAFKATPESSTRRKEFENELTIRCPDSEYRQFDWHARYTPGAGRIYFIPVEASGKLIIGYIGLKLA